MKRPENTIKQFCNIFQCVSVSARATRTRAMIVKIIFFLSAMCGANVLLALLFYGSFALYGVPVSDCSRTNGTVTSFSVSDYSPPLDEWQLVQYSYRYSAANETFLVQVQRWVPSANVEFWTERYSPVGRAIVVDYHTSNPAVLYDCTAILGPVLSATLGAVALITCGIVYTSFFAIINHWFASNWQRQQSVTIV
jgi:hypothetical protein